MKPMALYVVVCSLFIYSALLVSDVASKTRLGMSPNECAWSANRKA